MESKQEYFILTINPGSTSTKIGIFKNDELLIDKGIAHNDQDIASFKRVWDQYAFRKREILDVVNREGFDIGKLSCVVCRGGLLRPIVSGTYTINKQMLTDARNAIQGEHASNLGCVIAYGIGWDHDIPSYIVDPPSVDEIESVARISGHVAIKRRSLVHALNVKAIARAAAGKLGKPLDQLNLVVAHIGGGISIAPLRKGRIIDASDPLNGGPFSPERTGTLPMVDFTRHVLDHNLTMDQARKMLVGGGGMFSYLGTKSMIEAGEKYLEKEPRFQLILQAMAYQIAKEIGAMATALKGDIDAIVMTGGASHSEILVNLVREQVSFLAQLLVFPGEDELKALAQGALRVLKEEESPLVYPQQIQYKDWFGEENKQ
ncbi:MAG: butyrate kinase [bacterium]|nr:butyrate kinase [bacterium]